MNMLIYLAITLFKFELISANYTSPLKRLFVCKLPGVARRQVPLFCLSKIKEPNKKTPHITAFGSPALLGNQGVCGTRPRKTLRAQTVLADNSLIACATRRDVRGFTRNEIAGGL